MKGYMDKEDRLHDFFVTFVEAFGRCISAGIAIIDVEEEKFVCVSDNYSRLTNSSVAYIEEVGFKWYDDVFDQESIITLKAIDLKFKSMISSGMKELDEDFTFTCVLRLKNTRRKNALVQYTITPLCIHLDGLKHLMLTTMQYTHFKNQGHLEVGTKEGVFLYDSVTNVWERRASFHVSDADSDLVAFSLRGLSGKEIAKQKFVTDEAVKSQKSRMYIRFGVSSMEEAIGKLFNMGLQGMHWLRKLKKK